MMKGRALIEDVLQQHNIGVKDFFGSSRLPHLVNARREAIHLLQNAGFDNAAVARIMKRNYSTIQYWTKPSYRERQKAYAIAYWSHRREIAV